MQVLVPKIGFSMNEGRLVEWYAEDGDVVKEGEPLYGFESEKAVEEVPSPGSGVLKILVPLGEIYEVGVVLAEITEPG